MNEANEKSNEKSKAVAIKYDPKKGVAPEVVAKGYHKTAERIVTLAEENKVHIIKDKSLVDELLKVDLGNSIPEELYNAIASILVFIEQTDNKYKIREKEWAE